MISLPEWGLWDLGSSISFSLLVFFLLDSIWRPEFFPPWILFPVGENLKRNTRARTHTPPLLRAVKGPHADKETPKCTYFSNLPKSPKGWGGDGSGSLLSAGEARIGGLGTMISLSSLTPLLQAWSLVPVIPTPGLPSCREVNECAGQTSLQLPAAPSETTELFFRLPLLPTPSQLWGFSGIQSHFPLEKPESSFPLSQRTELVSLSGDVTCSPSGPVSQFSEHQALSPTCPGAEGFQGPREEGSS